jgi:hypothetical protein
MKRLLFITAFILIIHLNYAQLIDNKINIYTGYGLGIFHGKELLEESGFISPSLYSNYHQINGFLLKGLVKSDHYYCIGINFDFLWASKWHYMEYIDYAASELKQYSISPLIQFHNKFQESGFSNRFKLLVEISPTIGLSSLTLTHPLFDIQDETGSISPLLESNNVFYGLKGSTGLEIAINKAIGMFFTYSMEFCWIKSFLYEDNHFINSQLVCGLFIRLKKDKRFYY